jgi:hypothetical protein
MDKIRPLIRKNVAWISSLNSKVTLEYEGEFYDTIQVEAGPVRWKVWPLFREVEGRPKIDCNLAGHGQLLRDRTFRLESIRMYSPQTPDLAVLDRMYLSLGLNKDPIFETPLRWTFESGYMPIQTLIRKPLWIRPHDVVRGEITMTPSEGLSLVQVREDFVLKPILHGTVWRTP